MNTQFIILYFTEDLLLLTNTRSHAKALHTKLHIKRQKSNEFHVTFPIKKDQINNSLLASSKRVASDVIVVTCEYVGKNIFKNI